MAENYKKALDDAKAEAEILTEQVSWANKRLPQLRATIEALSILVANSPKSDTLSELGEVGISDAIRQVLRDAGCSLTPAQVKTKLTEAAFKLDYANASAVIHNTLKRLESQGEVVPVNTLSGTAYAIAPDYSNLAVLGQLMDGSQVDAISGAFERFKKAHDEQNQRVADAFKATAVKIVPKSEGGSK